MFCTKTLHTPRNSLTSQLANDGLNIGIHSVNRSFKKGDRFLNTTKDMYPVQPSDNNFTHRLQKNIPYVSNDVRIQLAKTPNA